MRNIFLKIWPGKKRKKSALRTGTLKRYQLIKESFVATLLVLLTVVLVSIFPFKFELAKAIRDGFKDFEVYDLHFMRSNLSKNTWDTSIVLVEIGNNRREIADQLILLDSLQPSVIGLDVTFWNYSNDSLGDLYLNNAVIRSDRIVLASQIMEDSLGGIRNHSSYFNDTGIRKKEGYINFIGDQYSVVRSFSPFVTINDSACYSFPARIIEKINDGQFQKLKKGNKKIELINFSGNLESFYHFSKEELRYYHLTNQLRDKVKGKIVLLGFFRESKPGESLLLDDLHFSPLNERGNSKSYPDIYGVVIHANIIAMILKGKYIWHASDFFSYLLAGVFTFFMILYILSCYRRKSDPSHIKFILLQIFLIIILSYIFLFIFSHFSIKMPLLPIILSLVLAVEMFNVYKWLAGWMNSNWKYETIFPKK